MRVFLFLLLVSSDVLANGFSDDELLELELSEEQMQSDEDANHKDCALYRIYKPADPAHPATDITICIDITSTYFSKKSGDNKTDKKKTGNPKKITPSVSDLDLVAQEDEIMSKKDFAKERKSQKT